eukprot:GCRY01001191.1.p1 GENE.GCRY01001191.1~~GCRY01001191.1.p1  ORF type:complete len:249 (-),score=20.88 GCRY01001191.1:128-874(-)
MTAFFFLILLFCSLSFGKVLETTTSTTLTQAEVVFSDGTTLSSLNEIQQLVDELQRSLTLYRLACSQSLVNGLGGWSTNPANCDATHELAFHVRFAVEWEDRTEEEQSILTAMNRKVSKYLLPFDVYRFKWSNFNTSRAGDDCFIGPYQRIAVSINQYRTVASFCKLVSGTVKEGTLSIATGAVLGEWRLCGGLSTGFGGGGYNHYVPQASSESGEILYALPAYVFGKVDLSNPLNWWFFPSINEVFF